MAGKWKVEEVIVSDNTFTDKREKKIFEELAKTILHFKGDGHFSFIYDGENQEIKRNIKDFENSIWRIIKEENLISLEKKQLLTIMPVDFEEKITFELIQGIKFQVLKTQNEKVDFSLIAENTQQNVVVKQKVDSIFKQVKVDDGYLKNIIISEYPVLEDCQERKDSSYLRSCMNNSIQKSIVDKLELKKYKSLVDHQRIKVFLNFVIDIDGIIKNIDVKSQDITLSYDLKLIINNIKIIAPALDENSQPILSAYTIPITLLNQ
ncbi:hypothetical protein [Aquimarina sp. MAR_2010_214]|uniref:hypothetical protein n=1 Tax=Aquimarina sp. MAR_2010_214 TaxID=1250026 RepID=UPI000C701346|nr:hypothetical protein [Aquimarina sp. MAR_2010_214]